MSLLGLVITVYLIIKDMSGFAFFIDINQRNGFEYECITNDKDVLLRELKNCLKLFQ